MKIIITKTEIRNGRRNSACDCPVNLAAEKAFGVPTRTSTTYIRRVNESIEYCFPYEVTERIRQFDNGEAMEPFEFELEV